MHDGACRSSRPEHHGTPTRHIQARIVSQAVQEAGPISVVPDQAVTIRHDAVDDA
tara:strand:+ start:168 stop:332 length:165 start_codon:yes stop_codon:yes gene_type:complete